MIFVTAGSGMTVPGSVSISRIAPEGTAEGALHGLSDTHKERLNDNMPEFLMAQKTVPLLDDGSAAGREVAWAAANGRMLSSVAEQNRGGWATVCQGSHRSTCRRAPRSARIAHFSGASKPLVSSHFVR